jgi:hypothetical protein
LLSEKLKAKYDEEVTQKPRGTLHHPNTLPFVL